MNTNKIGRRLLLGSAVVAVGAVSASAQQVIDLRSRAADPAASAPLFKIGSVDVRPSFSYGVTFDDNIFLAHRSTVSVPGGVQGKEEDFVHSLKPGVKLGMGDYMDRARSFALVSYQADVQLYQDHSGADALDHNAEIAVGGSMGRTRLGLSQTLVSQSDADQRNLAASGRLKRRIWTTTGTAVYDATDKTDIELELLSQLNDYTTPAYDTWRGKASAYWNYKLTPKIEAALGGAVGYDQVDGTATSHNPNSVFEQVNVRLRWGVTEKLSIQANGGLEFRQIQETGNNDKSFLIFGAGANWQVSQKSKATLSAQRGVGSSNVSQDQLAVETSVTGGYEHQIGERLTAGLQAGYILSDYQALLAAAAPAVREDQYWFFKPTLSMILFERATASAYYQYRRNDSDLAANGNDFTNHQIGLSLAYSF